MKIFAEIHALCRREIYQHPERIRAELSGAEILTTLLDAFYEANLDWEIAATGGCPIPPRSAVLMTLFPDGKATPRNKYDWLLGITDFVSGMTDSFALRQFREMRGIV